MESNENILDIFENDVVFKRFIDDKPINSESSSRVIQGMAVSHQLAKLAEGIGMLNHELHSQVSEHYEDLLSQATGIETLEGVLDMMQTRIQSILAAVDRTRHSVSEPYAKITGLTRQLTRLQDASDVIRTLIRVLQLSARLRGQLKVKDIAKAAQVIEELDRLCSAVDLNGIEIFEKDRVFFSQSRLDIQNEGARMLKAGLETQSQTQVGTALQVFHNLDALKTTVTGIINDYEKLLSVEIDSAIDTQRITASLNTGKSATTSNLSVPRRSPGVPGRVTMPSVGNTATFRVALWTSIGQLMDKIVNYMSLIHHLKRVLDMKKDSTTHLSFSQILTRSGSHGDDLEQLNPEATFNPLLIFWKHITKKLSSALNEAAENNTFLKQAFETEFPQLLRIFNDVWLQVKRYLQVSDTLTNQNSSGSDSVNSLSEPSDNNNGGEMLRAALSPFERSYLNRSLASLFDPVNLVFSSSGDANVPTCDDVDSLLKTISNELHISSIDPHLSLSVARNVGKTLQLFVVKSEQRLVTDGDASQVIGPPTSGQLTNVSIVNSLYRLHNSVQLLMKDMKELPPAALAYIVAGGSSLERLQITAVQPFLSSVSDALEAILLTMHSEPFHEENDGVEGELATTTHDPHKEDTSVQCSLYMRELKDFIFRVCNTHLPLFDCESFMFKQTLPLARRCIELFVRHASLIRPLSRNGKLRLASDFANLEHAVSPLVRCHLGDLGDTYRLLRALRPMLFQSNEHIRDSPCMLNGVLPASIVLHLLFSRAPQTFKSPIQLSGWSVSRFSVWLDNHPKEIDRLMLIKGSLETYARDIDKEGGTNYTPVYPIMLEILECSMAKLI